MTSSELHAKVMSALDDDDLDADDVEVDLVDDVHAAGATFFEVTLEGGGPGLYVPGAAIGGEVLFGREVALPKLLRALGPDAAPGTVAAVAGFLEATGDRTRAVLSAADAEDLKPAWRAHVTMPSVEPLADGGRRYHYWVTCGEPPLWRTDLTVATDGSVSLDRTEIWDLL